MAQFKKIGLKSRCYQFTPHFDMKNAPRRATFDRGAEMQFSLFYVSHRRVLLSEIA